MKKVTLTLIFTVSALIFLSTCKKDAEIKIELPTISTLEVTEITINSAKSGGNITNDGGGDIIKRGIVWSISQNPSIDLYSGITSDGTGTGVFGSNITELVSNTTYYVRAYSKNSAGVMYGNQEQFKTGILPEVAFSATPIEGFAPLMVEFIDHSTNNPVTWLWSFGDGNTSTQQNPIHTYEEAGNYTVQLTVTNIYGSDAEIKNDYVIVTSFICGNSLLTDINGNVYNTVLIGSQCWMKENLKTTSDIAGNNITRYCYNNNTDNCAWYGGLYTWQTVMNGSGSSNINPSGVQGICPTGWHVPSDAEWTQLVDYVAAQGFPNNNVTNGAGNALKSCRQINSPLGSDCNTSAHPRWNGHITHHGFDEFGFSALPGGSRSDAGVFTLFGASDLWWTSTEGSSTGAWYRRVDYFLGIEYRDTYAKSNGFSVRCLMDY